ncbi:Protein OS-9 [Thelohanellus kitauei]|uniref:Protein OS-9 n=1 Tax=Thelohanellus kitauei TaxID=669202 RepID=A0A0C2J6B5_THEKT|nr:Protein OS-9 [Thelohanellus kitauei]
MILDQPVKEPTGYMNHTYIVHNFKQKRLLCELPTRHEDEPQEPKQNSKTPNEVLSKYEGTCMEYMTQDYWNFSICIGKNVTQYHKDLDGVIRGDNYFLIGVFDSEKQWKPLELVLIKFTELSTHQYTNGSVCFGNLNRSAEVRFVCNSFSQNIHVSSYFEDSCNYVFTVDVKELCDIPGLHFVDKSVVLTIKCSPILPELEYNEYMKRQALQPFKETSGKDIALDSNIEGIDLISNNIDRIFLSLFSKNKMLSKDLFSFRKEDVGRTAGIDVKTIIEREGDERPILKWLISYKNKVDFDQILEQASSIEEGSMTPEEVAIMNLRDENLANSDPFYNLLNHNINVANTFFESDESVYSPIG